ncbi:MAG: hypothetical protein ABIQ04_01110 [Candidatus Saccharimonadales bacterium]
MTDVPVDVKPVKVKASDHDTYGVATIISLLLPIVGIIMGVVYLTKDKAEDKKLGEHLIAISILASIVISFIWFSFVSSRTPSVIPISTLDSPSVNLTPTSPPWDIEAAYVKISKGMTRAAVEAVIKKPAANCARSEQSGSADQYASCSYGGAGDHGIIVINYVNDIVTSTEKSTY